MPLLAICKGFWSPNPDAFSELRSGLKPRVLEDIHSSRHQCS